MNNRQVKKDYFWNTLGSGMVSLSSVVLLILSTKILGAYQGGVVAFAYAIAWQFQTLGQFEMRGYQSTDIEEQYKFGTYYASRFITCGLMFAGIVAYAFIAGGSIEDGMILILIASLKEFDAFEDVYHGMFQQKNKLYLAGRALFLRSSTTMLTFACTLLVSGNVFISCFLTIVASFVVMLLVNIPQAKCLVSLKPDFTWKALRSLLRTCFPLFLGAFLLIYIVNAPRYGIEVYYPKDYQAYFGALFMPTFLINLLSGFIFKPLLTTLASSWHKKNLHRFAGIIAKGILAIFGIACFIVIGGYFFGIPLLSWLYGLDLSDYRDSLICLLVGGMFSAISTILYYALLVARKQTPVFFGYAATAVVALFASSFFIQNGGIWGASVFFTGLMMFLVLIFTGMFLFFLKKQKENS